MPDLPAPPDHVSSIEWIAIVLVAAGIAGGVVWLPRILAAFREDRAEMLKAFQSQSAESLKAFREEAAAERVSHAAAVQSIREDHEAATARIHDRLDRIDQAVTTIAAHSRAA